MRTTIQKWGNSQAIRLPKEALETAQFKENESVQIFAEPDRIIIERVVASNHKTLKERLANFDGKYTFEEWNTGASIGNEIV